MYAFFNPSYLTRALIILGLIHWGSSHAKKLENLRDHNDASKISTSQHEKLHNGRGKYRSNVTSTERRLDEVHKRQKRCLLTMMALGSIAGLSDWFWRIVDEEPAPPTFAPQRRYPATRRTTTTRSVTRRPTTSISHPKIITGSQSCVTKWGFCISGGKPDYNLVDATYIMDVETRLVSNVWMVQFRHPITKETIQLPRDVPDEYVVTATRQVFIIFIDREGRTFLIFKRTLKPAADQVIRPGKVTDWFVTNPNTNILIIVNHEIFFSNTNDNNDDVGRLVVHNAPKYDPSAAIFIMNSKRKVVNGIWVIEFLHPPTKARVQVPMDMGDDYVVEATRQVFKVFVDFAGKTFMIFAGLDNPQNNSDKSAGVPSIENVPPYDIIKAIWIDKVVQKVVKGILMIEFMHPDTREIVRVPFNVGDVHVEPTTQKVYLIFVDNKGQTLLIFKGLVRVNIDFFRGTVGSIVTNNKPRYNVKNATFVRDTRRKYGLDGKPILEWIHPETMQIVQIPLDVGQVYVDEKTDKVYAIFVDVRGRTFLILKGVHGKDRRFPKDKNIVGRLVINGVPNYDLINAIFVMETELKILADGSTVVVFEHPITKEKAQIPPKIGDQHVDKRTGRIFIILVDVEGRTLLIFKGWRNDDEERRNYVDPRQIGHLVVDGSPKWNLRTAIIIRETVRKIAADGTIFIEFRHPIVKRRILIPRDEGDDYEMKETGEIFKIFVGYFDRTFLILKTPGNAAKDDDDTEGKLYDGLKIVVRGVPKYETTRAIFIEDTEQMLDRYGRIVIFFENPTNKRRIFLPYRKGDVYVNPRTKRVYKICVDSEGRTLMVYMRDERDKKERWITVVKGGLPAHDLSKGMVVMDTEIKRKRVGTFVSEFVEFRHPVSRLTLRISSAGADRYFKPETQQVFIICVDNRGRTLLVFEGMQSDLSWQKDPEIKWVKVYPKNETTGGSGSIVVDGYPPYDLSRAIYVFKVTRKRGFDGEWKILFEHPKTKEIVQVPMHGGDERLDEKTGKVFVIYVDGRKDTFLILKPDLQRSSTISSNRLDVSNDSREIRNSNYGSNDENLNENINVNINRNIKKNFDNGNDDF